MRLKKNCSTCSARVGDDYCTKQLDMGKANYSNCVGWHIAPENPRKPIISDEELAETKSLREQRILDKFDLGSEWDRYIVKGGHYSFRTKSHIILVY